MSPKIGFMVSSNLPQEVVYAVDSHDRITFVNEGWKAFAREQNTPELAGEALGTSLWSHIHSQEIEHVYRIILKKIRAAGGEAEIRFPFRCDSPSMERHMEMRICRSMSDVIEFRTIVLREIPRPAIPVFDPAAMKSSSFVVMCAWCNKIKSGEKWLTLEEGLQSLPIFQGELPPRISHGICPGCAQVVSAGWLKKDE